MNNSLTRQYEAGENNQKVFLFNLGVTMPKGNIRCSKCHKAMNKASCICGHTACYISIYWKKKQYRMFRYYLDNELFNYTRALKQLTEMNFAIEQKKFNPADWTTQAIQERIFLIQAEKWLKVKGNESERNELSYGTLNAYKGFVKNHWNLLHKYDVKEIRYEQLETLKDTLPGKMKTRRNSLNALHAFWAWMRRKGIVNEIPVWPTIEGDDSIQRSAIDYEEQMAALDRIPVAERSPIEFGFETGLRPGETCALKVKDINQINKQALIQRTWSGSRLRETTKSKKKNWIPLSNRAWDIITLLLRDKHPEAFIFINPRTGKGYRPDTLQKSWKKYSKTNIDHYSASRHSFCTQLTDTGINSLQARELMRHTDIRTTQKYFHASTEKLREAVNQRGKVLPFKKASDGSLNDR